MQEGREATKSRQAGTLIDRDASTLVLAFRQASRYSVVQSVRQTDRQTVGYRAEPDGLVAGRAVLVPAA